MAKLSDKVEEKAQACASKTDGDPAFMHLALEQARAAGRRGEVPVGAVLVSADGLVLAQAGNGPIAGSDPTGHAEILALRAAAQTLGNYRLAGCTLYVTLEPCPMCMSAIALARLARVVYAAADERLGACGGAGGNLNLAANKALNPHTQVEGGLCSDDAAALLKAFFEGRRPPKEERLTRIAVLEDVPNIDTALAAWLRQQGMGEPAALAVLLDDAVFAQFLNRLQAGPAESDEHILGLAVLRARLKAVRHFVAGGAALPWKSFLNDE